MQVRARNQAAAAVIHSGARKEQYCNIILQNRLIQYYAAEQTDTIDTDDV